MYASAVRITLSACHIVSAILNCVADSCVLPSNYLHLLVFPGNQKMSNEGGLLYRHGCTGLVGVIVVQLCALQSMMTTVVYTILTLCLRSRLMFWAFTETHIALTALPVPSIFRTTTSLCCDSESREPQRQVARMAPGCISGSRDRST
jgi:hypothetical protein